MNLLGEFKVQLYTNKPTWTIQQVTLYFQSQIWRGSLNNVPTGQLNFPIRPLSWHSRNLCKSKCRKFKLTFSKIKNQTILKLYSPYIFVTWWCEYLIFRAFTIWSKKIYSLKYQWSTTNIRIKKSEFVSKTQFLSWDLH